MIDFVLFKMSQKGSVSKSHVTPLHLGDPGNAMAAERQWQNATLNKQNQ